MKMGRNEHLAESPGAFKIGWDNDQNLAHARAVNTDYPPVPSQHEHRQVNLFPLPLSLFDKK